MIIYALYIINDTLERDVKLMEEYNKKFNKNQIQKQVNYKSVKVSSIEEQKYKRMTFKSRLLVLR